ncbi:MAG: carboxypeptidase regulatory-like domain-containing protein [Bacteroidetes bacterium]|nr:MAG: carboxypeptidase regulatory-like domain-containing protein [Bacteroidota bacterium]
MTSLIKTGLVRKPFPLQRAILLLVFSFSLFQSCDRFAFFPERSTIEGIALDGISFEKLNGATLSLRPAPGGSATTTGDINVDEDGRFRFENVTTGVYTLNITLDGYEKMEAGNIEVDENSAFVAMLPVKTNLSLNTGGISGIVRDNNGNPVPNANVAVSAQDVSLTNGYFASAVTNEDGHFYIAAIPLDKTNEFRIRCAAHGFETKRITSQQILNNEMLVLQLELAQETQPQVLFYEGFENDQHVWQKTGFWRIQQNNAIYNKAYPKFVKLAPNDNSYGKIPDAFRGTRMAWYGQPSTGNYMGEQSPYDFGLTGGTSKQANHGEMISPLINLSATQSASVIFWSWFEIESMNPDGHGFDHMKLYVIREDSNSPVLVGMLNPYIIPILNDREAMPYTTGGFYQAPVWRYEEFDISDFTGSSVQLKFVFDTRDEKHNGFRGWFIDEIRVVEREGQYKQTPATLPLRQR